MPMDPIVYVVAVDDERKMLKRRRRMKTHR
jgi:hypothetical protein